MTSQEVQNKNPSIHKKFELDTESSQKRSQNEQNPHYEDLIDALEVFDIIRNIYDPEHPLTLEELNVVSIDDVQVDLNQKLQVMFILKPNKLKILSLIKKSSILNNFLNSRLILSENIISNNLVLTWCSAPKSQTKHLNSDWSPVHSHDPKLLVGFPNRSYHRSQTQKLLIKKVEISREDQARRTWSREIDQQAIGR